MKTFNHKVVFGRDNGDALACRFAVRLSEVSRRAQTSKDMGINGERMARVS